MERTKCKSAHTTIAEAELPHAAILDNVIPSQNFSLPVRLHQMPFHQEIALMGILQMGFYTSEMIHLPHYS